MYQQFAGHTIQPPREIGKTNLNIKSQFHRNDSLNEISLQFYFNGSFMSYKFVGSIDSSRAQVSTYSVWWVNSMHYIMLNSLRAVQYLLYFHFAKYLVSTLEYVYWPKWNIATSTSAIVSGSTKSSFPEKLTLHHHVFLGPIRSSRQDN